MRQPATLAPSVRIAVPLGRFERECPMNAIRLPDLVLWCLTMAAGIAVGFAAARIYGVEGGATRALVLFAAIAADFAYLRYVKRPAA